MNRSIATLAPLFLACVACGAEESSPSRSEGRFAMSSTHAVHAIYARHPLCERIESFAGGAGLYRVESLTAVLEDPPGSLTNKEITETPFTYAQLHLVEPWTDGAPSRPVVRMKGGAYGDGRVGPTTVALKVGEELVTALSSPDENGFYRVDRLGVFHDVEGIGFSNGMHVIGADKLAAQAQLRSMIGKSVEECRPYDVSPPRPAPGPVGPIDEVVNEGEIILESGGPEGDNT